MADLDYLYVTGRLVQGSVFEAQTKNMQGGPLLDMKGDPKIQYFIAVAVPKTDQAMLAEWGKLQQIAAAGFPGGESQRADFAWKVIDGDVAPHNNKIGFPGCYVFRLTSGYAFKSYTKGGENQIVDPNQIKRGYYIRVAFTVKPNGNLQKPGLYLNICVVELIGYGEEINVGPDGAAILGGAPPVIMPVGASATPVAGATPLAGGPAPGAPIAGGPAPVMTPPISNITPAPDFLNQPAPGAPIAGGPAPGAPIAGGPAPVMTPPVPAGPIMTAKAAGTTYDQFIAQGWTQEQLVQHGYVQP